MKYYLSEEIAARSPWISTERKTGRRYVTSRALVEILRKPGELGIICTTSNGQKIIV